MTETASNNPYASPVVPDRPEVRQRARVATRVRIPAGCLFAAAGLHVLFMAVMATFLISTAPNWPRLFAKVGIINAIGFAFYLLEQSFLIYAAIRMWRLQSLILCRTAGILACLPFLTPGVWLGMPFGIWAAIVLFMPSTAKEFDSKAGRAEVVTEAGSP
jgi:hypothetical protein